MLARLRRFFLTWTDVHTVFSCHRYVYICGIEAFRFALFHTHSLEAMETANGRRKYVVVM